MAIIIQTFKYSMKEVYHASGWIITLWHQVTTNDKLPKMILMKCGNVNTLTDKSPKVRNYVTALERGNDENIIVKLFNLLAIKI